MTVPSAAALKAWNSRTAEQRIGRFAGDWMEGFDAAIKAMGEPVLWMDKDGHTLRPSDREKWIIADPNLTGVNKYTTPLYALPKDK